MRAPASVAAVVSAAAAMLVAADAGAQASPEAVRVEVEQATVLYGNNAQHAGFLIADDLVVGAAHCLAAEPREGLAVRFRDGTQVTGTVVAISREWDIGLISVPPMHGHRPLELSTRGDDIDRGENVVHAGHPRGYPFLVQLGRFRGVARGRGQATPLLRFSTSVEPGDSGGPLVCSSGRVHGVVVQGSRDGAEAFAVPVEFVVALVESLDGDNGDDEDGEQVEEGVEEQPEPEVAAERPRRQRARRRVAPRSSAPEPVQRARIVLYGESWCPACRAARSWLVARGVRFVERRSAALQAFAARRGLRPRGIPVVVIGGEVIEGFDPTRMERALRRQRQ